jgi:hypothetical protein
MAHSNSKADLVLRLGSRLDGRQIGVQVGTAVRPWTASGAHPVSYPDGTTGSFPGGKAGEICLLTSNWFPCLASSHGVMLN